MLSEERIALEELRKTIREETERRGHPLTACVVTFGCQMNERDSEKLRGILLAAGFEGSDSEEADIVIFNTCTVRENANTRLYGHLGHLNSMKREHPDKIIGICGCMMQEKDEVEKIRTKYRFVDIVFGTYNIYRLAAVLNERMVSGKRVIEVWDKEKGIVEDLPVKRDVPWKSGVNIMFGCNNFCSYCIVPYVRGRERSREPKDILREVESLAKDGVIEVMLLGQNVNSYGKTLDVPMSFAGCDS